MQVRLVHSRMANDPPDLLVTPSLQDFALLDFDRAGEAIAEGGRALERALAECPPLEAAREDP
jgi:NTE family protein